MKWGQESNILKCAPQVLKLKGRVWENLRNTSAVSSIFDQSSKNFNNFLHWQEAVKIKNILQMPAKMPWFFYEESKIHESDHCHSFSTGICLTSKSKCSILFRNIDGMRRLIGQDTRVSILKKTLNRQETNVQSNFFNPTLANCGMSGMFCYYDTNSPCSFNSTGNNAAVALRKINGIYNLWPAMHTALLVTILMGTNKANILFDWFCLQFASSIKLQILDFKNTLR